MVAKVHSFLARKLDRNKSGLLANSRLKSLQVTIMKHLLIQLLLSLFVGLPVAVNGQVSQKFSSRPLPTSNLGSGVNFGNMLEAPNEGDWGLMVEDVFFDRAVEAGFEHIRLPVSWTHHAQLSAPYTIDPKFMNRVEYVVDEAIAHGLKVLLNNHHYDALNDNPVSERTRALALWQQIATRFQNRSNEMLFFEVLNEPHGQFNNQPELWNQFLADATSVIRQNNPDRKIVAGPVFWNSIRGLDSFQLPQDPNFICTFHYYSPFEFTHQGATWVDPIPPLGTLWFDEIFGMVDPFQDWSWNTTWEGVSNGLVVSSSSGYSGFQIHSPNPVGNCQSVDFTVDQAMQLKVAVSNNQTGAQFEQILQTTSGTSTYSIDVSSFGNTNQVTNVLIQNLSSDSIPPYLLSHFALKTSKSNYPLIGNARSVIWTSMRNASRWSLENQTPIYLGEFGAFDMADFDSRVRWTRAVRQSAELMNIDWAYWELAASFGIYDPENETWRLELLRALKPNF